jgi:hypothetical protein
MEDIIVIVMKKVLSIILFVFFTMTITAQDFGIWYEVDIVHNVKKFDLKLANVVRTFNNGGNIQMYYFEPGVVYNFNKYFSSGLYYRYINQQGIPFGRWSVEMNGKFPINKFSLVIRYRLQEQSTSEFEKMAWFNRLRFQLDYNTKHFRPYVSAELFNQISPNIGFGLQRERYIGGIEFKINKNHFPAIEYVRYDNYQSSAKHMNILALKYILKL